MYDATRLMFGDRASPYLAHYVVRRHAQDNKDGYPLAAAIILLQMCMDDITGTSLETKHESVVARDHPLSYLERQASTYDE